MASRNVSMKRGKNSSKVLKIDEAEIRNHLTGVVKQTAEETLNGMPDAEADRLCKAKRYGTHPRRSLRAPPGQARSASSRSGDLQVPFWQG